MACRSNVPLSRLPIRMRDDLVLAGKSPKTVKIYLASVRAMAWHYAVSPDRLTEERVRAYLVYLTVKQ
ncbi:MAG: phage integrase N-terminal SAM-like domain-containing protein, partial [Planctomycetota bacterium]|nr:phage integrase N-terminal SAM-like domain-containing protein [Planctomycetota bacterium]